MRRHKQHGFKCKRVVYVTVAHSLVPCVLNDIKGLLFLATDPSALMYMVRNTRSDTRLAALPDGCPSRPGEAGSSSAQPPVLQGQLEQCHANVQAILSLPEVCSARVRVYVRRNLINAGEGVHDAGAGLHEAQQVCVHDILPASRAVVLQPVQKPLLLNAGLVQHVHVSRYCCQVVHLLPLYPLPGEVLLDVLFHTHHLRRHEVHLHPGVHGQHVRQRPHRAPIRQVTDKADGKVLKPPNLPLDCVHVQ
mmetsp:Transcript_18938/g.57206  ORF Transcript_18938/g.57206 Transcript_18938/m.57206 type:complete len:249 (+) Transcript_18938:88-834(+)